MPSIMDTISQGVATPELNKAVLGLVSVFGENLINGTGGAPSMLVTLSAALNPVYIGLLFMILAYIGIGGVVNTAREGRFLGKWSSVGVPGMLILCIVLLSPIPSQNGVTMGQYVFIKSVKFGSNFADYMLFKVFDTAGQQAVQQTESYSLAQEHLPQVNTQMSAALLMYICGENLKAMGYGTRVDYFRLLKNVCGIPADLQGVDQVAGFAPDYQSFFMLTKAHVQTEQAELNALATMAGLPAISQTYYNFNAVNAAAAANGGAGSPASQQLACHFKSFRTHFNQLSSEVSAASSVTGYAIESYSGASKPNQVNSNVVPVNVPGLEAAWALALNSSYDCIMTVAMQGRIKEVYQPTARDTGSQNSSSPWRAGWVDAALSIQDNLEKYKSTASTTKFPLLMNSIANPDYTKLGDNLTDKKNAELLMNASTEVYDFLMRPDNSPSKIADALAMTRSQKLAEASSGATAATAVVMNNSELARIVANTAMLPLINSTNRRVTDMNTSQKSNLLSKIFNSLIGKAATAIPSALGSVSKVAVQAIGKIHAVMEKKAKLEKIAQDAGSAQVAGFSVGKLFSIGKSIYDIVKPGDTIMTILSIVVIALNAVVLLPQLVLLLVFLLWLARVAVWYMIIPLATVIIALPNTRAGHDIWKSALSIVITPILALIFYLVSLFLFDQMYSAVFTWIFSPIINADGKWSTSVSILEQLFTGELIFRLMMGFGVAIAVTMYMSMMILKGPDLVTRSLGLSGSSSDLGQDLENLRHSKTMNLGSHGIV